MASLPDDVKERAIAIKAANPEHGFKKILSMLKADMPGEVIPSSTLRSYLRENANVIEKAIADSSKSVPSIVVTPERGATRAIPTDPRTQGRHFVIQQIPGKGKVLIATRDIKAGELVLAEEPLIRMDERSESYIGIRAKLAKLTPGDRSASYDLHRSGRQSQSPELDIFATNSFSIGDHEGDGGVFLIGNRLNHSCLPNTAGIWQESFGQRWIHAIKDIKKGQELTIPYVSPVGNYVQRRVKLHLTYGFEWTCETWSLKGAAPGVSDDSRALVKSIDKELDMGLAIQPRRKMALIEQAEKPLKNEGLVTPLYDFYLSTYMIQFSVLKNIPAAKSWAIKLYGISRIVRGEKDEKTLRYKEFTTKPGMPEVNPLEEMMMAMMMSSMMA